MKRIVVAALVSGLISSVVAADPADPGPAQDGPPGVKAMSGMSVLGNNEAPKSLVIVPWKSSELGDGLGIENLLDERAQPVDRDVFQRELDYYELRTGQTASAD